MAAFRNQCAARNHLIDKDKPAQCACRRWDPKTPHKIRKSQSHTEVQHNHSGNHCIRLSSIPDKQDTFLAMQQIFIRTDMSEV